MWRRVAATFVGVVAAIAAFCFAVVGVVSGVNLAGRAVVVGEKPTSLLVSLFLTGLLVTGTLAALALAVFLLRPRRSSGIPATRAQIAGETCDACDAAIVTEREGIFCETCNRPLHARCVGAHTTEHLGTATPYRA